MLDEELIDLMTFCLQNPDSVVVYEKHKRITEIGHELYADGGVDALENFFCVKKQNHTRNRKRSIHQCVRYGMVLLMNGSTKLLNREV